MITMKKAIILLLLATAGIARAQHVPDSPPVNTDAVLKELQQIKDTRENSIKNQLGQVLQTVNSAASNGGAALDLYLQAQFATQFDGQSHEKTQFQEWKKKEADKLKSKSFQEALRLYLIYLSLTLQSSSGVKTADLIPHLVGYTTQVLSEADFLADGNELMKKALGESIIVRGLGVNLNPAAEWVMIPGNIDEMYQKVILPELREKKDPAAVEYWSRKIDRESDASASSKRNFDADRFAKTRKPTLLWNRAKEFYLIGYQNRGIAEMLVVIKTYPTHPDAAAWAEQLEQYLGKK